MSRESLTRLAELTGFARPTLKARLANIEPIKRGTSLLYETRDALPRLYDKDASVYKTDAERARLLHHQANLADLEQQVKQGDLIPADQVLTEWSSKISNARARLLSLPAALGARCPGGTSQEIEQEARKIVNDALEELERDNGRSESHIDRGK